MNAAGLNFESVSNPLLKDIDALRQDIQGSDFGQILEKIQNLPEVDGKKFHIGFNVRDGINIKAVPGEPPLEYPLLEVSVQYSEKETDIYPEDVNSDVQRKPRRANFFRPTYDGNTPNGVKSMSVDYENAAVGGSSSIGSHSFASKEWSPISSIALTDNLLDFVNEQAPKEIVNDVVEIYRDQFYPVEPMFTDKMGNPIGHDTALDNLKSADRHAMTIQAETPDVN